MSLNLALQKPKILLVKLLMPAGRGLPPSLLGFLLPGWKIWWPETSSKMLKGLQIKPSLLFPSTSPPAHLGRRCLESLRPDSHSPFSQQARLSSAFGLRVTSCPVPNPFFTQLSFLHCRVVFLTYQGREVRALVRLGFPTG